ncbi:MAG: hypothetical protein WCQ41_04010 [Bacillota bacterium]
MELNVIEFKKEIVSRGWSQNLCAKMLSVSKAYLSKVISGQCQAGEKLLRAIGKKFRKEGAAILTAGVSKFPKGNKRVNYVNKDKLCRFIESKNMKKCEFARAIGISRGALTNLLNHRNGVGKKVEEGFKLAFPKESLKKYLIKQKKR